MPKVKKHKIIIENCSSEIMEKAQKLLKWIKNNPEKIINELKKHMSIQTEKIFLMESKKNGTFYNKKINNSL